MRRLQLNADIQKKVSLYLLHLKLVITKMPTFLRQFASLSEWIALAESPCDTPDNQRETIRGYFVNRKTSMADSNEEAFQLFRKGWPEGKERMLSILNVIRNVIRLDCVTHEFFSSVEGSAPNVDAYLHSDPEDMFHLEEIKVEAPPSFLQVQLDCGFPHDITATQMTWAGATIFAAMEALRAQGCAVNLLLTHSVQSSRSDYFWQSSVPVPNTIDIDTLSFLLTNPSTLRRIIFSLREHETEEIRRIMGFYIGGGYGITHTLKNNSAEVCLALHKIASRFSEWHPEYNLPTSQSIFRNLIDTKFQKY